MTSFSNIILGSFLIEYKLHLKFLEKRYRMSIKKTKICFISNNHVSVMKQSADLSLTSSMSFILSLAEYLQNKIKLKPPNLQSYLSSKFTPQLENHFLNPHQCDYFQAWCDYIFELLAKGNVLKANDEILFVTSVDEDYFKENLSKNKNFRTQVLIRADNFDLRSHLKDSLHQEILSQVPKKGKKVAIINFSASVANLDKLKPKIHLEGLYAGQFYRFGDQWQSFKIISDQIPTVKQINHQDVLILTGSSYSVNNMCPQMIKFGKNILQAIAINKRLKIIGTCFGHQYLCYLHGSTVIQRKFVKGPQKISFTSQQNSLQAPFLNEILNHQRKEYKLFEYHNDHVCSIPQGFLKVGESQSCELESLISKDQRIWTYQFHPQYTSQYIKTYEQRYIAYQKGKKLQKEEHKVDKDHHDSHKIIRNAIRKFIDWIK